MDGRENRRLELNRVLVDLARAAAEGEGSLEADLGRIARAAAETLGVERASVWLFNDDRSAILCTELYERTPDRHSRGVELSARDHPAYFQALESERTIAAHEARTDLRTREFTAGYLEPLGITSMLDAPIRVGGRMIGVMCHEHVGPLRQWTEPEQSFAGSIADAVSLALEENERRRMGAALRESEERYRRIVETALEGIWSVDAQGVTIYANPRMAEMLGYTVEELIGRNAFDLADPGDLERAHQHWERRKEGVAERPEFRFVRKDGTVLWTYCSATPILDAAGNFAGSFAMVIDITDRKRAEVERTELLAREQAARAEAEAANRIKDEFLATVSHELRTPLSAMIGWVHLLRTGALDTASTERALETIERNIRAQAQIIEDILDVSRIIRGSLKLDLSPLDLAVLIQETVESLRPTAQAKGVSLHTILESPESRINGDPDRLQQVVRNLLSNAIKFTPKSGSVEVRLRRRGDDLQMEMTDTGEGIAPSFLPYVFERFRQADGSTTRVHGGLGLGLSIVRHLVELHGGTAVASSPGLGQGSRFVVTLPALPASRPVAPAPAEAPPGAVEPSRPAPLAGLRILFVDDHPDTCEAMALVLCRSGAHVATASSVPAALESLDAAIPDLLIADLGMPGEDGYDLIRHLRSRPAWRGGNVPAIALTAYARPEDRERAFAAGYQVHIAKPADPDEILAAVTSLAGRRS